MRAEEGWVPAKRHMLCRRTCSFKEGLCDPTIQAGRSGMHRYIVRCTHHYEVR